MKIGFVISLCLICVCTVSAQETFFCKGFSIEGNTAFSDKVVRDALKDYSDKELRPDDLFDVQEIVSKLYQQNGYITSLAIIPDQQVKDGVVKIQIREGQISRVNVQSNWLRPSYFESRLKTEPLNAFEIEKRLRLIRQSPLVDQIEARLYPDLEPGKAILDVRAIEAQPFHARVGVSNHNAPSVGAYRGEVQLKHDNLTGFGDSIKAEYGLTEGLDDYSLDYKIPITGRDTTLSLSFDRNDAEVTEEPFDRLDITNETNRYGFDVRHPVSKNLDSELGIAIGYERAESETRLLGEPFDFSGYSKSGEYDLDILRLTQDWVKRWSDKVFAVESQIDLNEDYTRWLVQTQFLYQLKDSQLALRCDFQIADSLPPSERFSIGGHDTVRGYRENTLTTDSGVIGSLEWRIKIPLFDQLNFVSFFDWGRGYNEDKNPDINTLSSVGFGLVFDVWKFHGNFYWGIPLKEIDYEKWDLQNDGVCFSLSADLL